IERSRLCDAVRNAFLPSSRSHNNSPAEHFKPRCRGLVATGSHRRSNYRDHYGGHSRSRAPRCMRWPLLLLLAAYRPSVREFQRRASGPVAGFTLFHICWKLWQEEFRWSRLPLLPLLRQVANCRYRSSSSSSSNEPELNSRISGPPDASGRRCDIEIETISSRSAGPAGLPPKKPVRYRLFRDAPQGYTLLDVAVVGKASWSCAVASTGECGAG
uniref:Uncharacterized protein n=1 Tax=Anopheles albimanus TaxID=7167 RepID=A0A182F579_ANOAL